MDKLSRRSFFKAAGVAAAGVSAQAHALKRGTLPDARQAPQHSTAYTFFRPDEAAFIEAAVDRLIPPDPTGPSAREAGVPSYLDKQLGGAWGAGERLYRAGPWQEGTPSQGYQLPFTPAELFRNALRGVQEQLQKSHAGTPFGKLTPEQQDEFLKSLQTGKTDLNGVPSNVFFESLLSLTVEGYFSDPVYGGNKDMAAWKMIGFPGAYASYYHLVDQHGVAFNHPPMSIGDDGRGVIRIHPNIPATPHGDTPAPAAHTPSGERKK